MVKVAEKPRKEWGLWSTTAGAMERRQKPMSLIQQRKQLGGSEGQGWAERERAERQSQGEGGMWSEALTPPKERAGFVPAPGRQALNSSHLLRERTVFVFHGSPRDHI